MRPRGQFLVGAVAFLAFLLIIIQAMVWFTQSETKWTQKAKKSEVAFYLAETGVNKAIWMLQETSDAFSNVWTNGVPAGYANDTVYTDAPGGSYRILIATTSGSALTVTGTGKDSLSREYRAIQVVLSASSATYPAAVYVGGSGTNNVPKDFMVYWGPIYSPGILNLLDDTNQLYPQKYSGSNITGSGGPFYAGYVRDTNGATPPNTDGLEWWTYQPTSVVPSAPAIDLNYYLNAANAQGHHISSGQTYSTPFIDSAGTSVYYFDGSANVTFSSTTYIYGTVIFNPPIPETLSFNGVGGGSYAVTPPSNAWQQYQVNTPYKGAGGAGCPTNGGMWCGLASGFCAAVNKTTATADTACYDQYPGDSGLHSVESYNFATGCASHGSGGGATLTPVTIRGFLYIGNGSVTSTSTQPVTIHGAMQLETGASMVTGGKWQVFYDPNVQPQQAASSGSGFTQTSWKEVLPVTF